MNGDVNSNCNTIITTIKFKWLKGLITFFILKFFDY